MWGAFDGQQIVARGDGDAGPKARPLAPASGGGQDAPGLGLGERALGVEVAGGSEEQPGGDWYAQAEVVHIPNGMDPAGDAGDPPEGRQVYQGRFLRAVAVSVARRLSGRGGRGKVGQGGTGRAELFYRQPGRVAGRAIFHHHEGGVEDQGGQRAGQLVARAAVGCKESSRRAGRCAARVGDNVGWKEIGTCTGGHASLAYDVVAVGRHVTKDIALACNHHPVIIGQPGVAGQQPQPRAGRMSGELVVGQGGGYRVAGDHRQARRGSKRGSAVQPLLTEDTAANEGNPVPSVVPELVLAQGGRDGVVVGQKVPADHDNPRVIIVLHRVALKRHSQAVVRARPVGASWKVTAGGVDIGAVFPAVEQNSGYGPVVYCDGVGTDVGMRGPGGGGDDAAVARQGIAGDSGGHLAVACPATPRG